MRNFNILAVLAVATLAVSACSMDEDMAYLGSRDDIIVNNKGLPNKAVIEKITEATIETVKVDAADALDTAEKEALDAVVEKVAAEVEMKPMDTTTMKSEEVVAVVEEAVTTTEKPVAPVMPEAGDTPSNAKPGECYAKVLIPGISETTVEKIQISEEHKVLARVIPAKYEVTTERIMIKEARQYWKRGRGPVERLDETTGGILCLVEEPAEYKTIEKRTLVAPEEPEYKTVPAKFENITKNVVIKAERLEWRRILCDTNVTPATIRLIQTALETKGYKSGPIDGRFGSQTLKALNKYQRDNNLASRGITYETLNHLGVSLAGA